MVLVHINKTLGLCGQYETAEMNKAACKPKYSLQAAFYCSDTGTTASLQQAAGIISKNWQTLRVRPRRGR